MNNHTTIILLLCTLVCSLYAAQTIVDVSNITSAIQNAQDGDQLILLHGTYPNLNFTMYGISLSFVSESGNPDDVIMDGEGRNDVAPFMIYYDTNFTSRAPKLPTSLSISGIKFLNCGSSSRDPNDTTTVYIGGAIYLDSYDTSNVNLNITNCVFDGGFSDIGGVIYADAIDAPIAIYVSNTSFSGTSAIWGSALYIQATTTDPTATAYITLVDCTFNSNTAFLGGALYIVNSVANISSSNFTENGAAAAGGAAIFWNSHVTMTDCNFVQNAADLGGAFIVVEGLVTTFNVNIAQNVAENAGGIYVNGTLFFEGGHLDTNFASENGGAMFVDDKRSVTLQKTKGSGNGATKQGSFAYCSGGSIKIVQSDIDTQGAPANEKHGVYCDPNDLCTVSGDWGNVCAVHAGKHKSNNIGGWAIALIVIFVLAAVVAVVGLIFYIKRKKPPTSFAKM